MYNLTRPLLAILPVSALAHGMWLLVVFTNDPRFTGPFGAIFSPRYLVDP